MPPFVPKMHNFAIFRVKMSTLFNFLRQDIFARIYYYIHRNDSFVLEGLNMLARISDKIIRKLMPNEIGSDSYEICRYGCELWIYTIISTAGLLLVGWLMNSFAESVAMVCIFYLCQSNGGGYHATTHIGCFLTMLTGLLCGLLLIRIPLTIIFYEGLAVTACLVLLICPLQLHKIKSYLQADAAKLRRRSRFVTILITVFLIFTGFVGWDILFRSECIAVGMSAISRLYAKLAEMKS